MGLELYFRINIILAVTVFSSSPSISNFQYPFHIFFFWILLHLGTQENLRESKSIVCVLISCFLSTMAAFTCTSRPPISLRSEMRIVASSPTVSLSTRQMFSVLPESGGLRTRVSLSSVSRNSRVSRLRRGVICEAQETATGSMFSRLCYLFLLDIAFFSL